MRYEQVEFLRDVEFKRLTGVKRHTLKSEVLIDLPTRRILATAQAPGRTHDLRLRRERGSRLPANVQAVVDLGYQGLQHEHGLTLLPFKDTKQRPLAAIERAITSH